MRVRKPRVFPRPCAVAMRYLSVCTSTQRYTPVPPSKESCIFSPWTGGGSTPQGLGNISLQCHFAGDWLKLFVLVNWGNDTPNEIPQLSIDIPTWLLTLILRVSLVRFVSFTRVFMTTSCFLGILLLFRSRPFAFASLGLTVVNSLGIPAGVDHP